MKRLTNKKLLALLCATTLCLGGCSTGGMTQKTDTGETASAEGETNAAAAAVDTTGMDFEYSKRDLDASYDDASATHITLSGSSANIEGTGATADGSTVTIAEEGTYVVSGSLSGGQVVIEAAADAKVQVVLAGVTIHNEDGPALYVRAADKVFVTLAEGTTNALTDGASYALEDGSDEPYATLFSKADLTINGSGALEVKSAYRHAICSKDDLVITGGTYAIEAVEDALRGRDCVKICGGAFDIVAGEDAVKSNNDEDATRGFVSIDGGTFAIACGDDAVHAETVMRITDGTVDASTCYEGYEGQQVLISGGTTHITATDDALNAAAAGTNEQTTGDVPVGGAWTGDGARGGMPTGEMPAGEDPTGEAPVGGMPTGEASAGTGEASTTASSETSATPGGQAGMAEGGMGMGDESCLIQISGGYTVLDAAGDAVDSNGNVEITGGVLLVNGPADGANGAFDYDLSATVSGGTVLMVGAAGMAQNFTSGTQPFAFSTVSGSAGQSVAIVDDTGRVLASLTAAKSFGMVLASAPGMAEGKTYSLVIGGAVANANADGFVEGGTVSGGTTTEITASTTASGGMGGLGAGGAGMPAGTPGDVQRGFHGGA